MRIKSIMIGSYGKLKDKEFQLTDGLNVFFGPNESGKTTTMEFIRNVLVPSKKRATYPERSKNDSGSIVLSDGEDLIIDLKDRGPIPQCISDMDPELYRTIFAMNQSGLDDMSSFSNNDIRSRFLTIPGGENMPIVIESIEEDVKNTIGLTSRSPSVLNDIQSQENDVLDRIAELRSNAESYNELCEQRKSLQNELDSIIESNKGAIENNQLYSKVESQRSTYDELQVNLTKKAAYKDKPTLGRDDVTTHDRLLSEFNSR